jgi:DHA1 family bicyclomycin/chloramphenicol resistance-like MFS transporter
MAGWRAIFAVQAATGLALLVAVVLGLSETRRPCEHKPVGSILTERRTLAFGVVGALNLANVFCFVSGAPLLLLGTLQLSTMQFGWAFALITSGVIAGAAINRFVSRQGWTARLPLGLGLVGATLAALAGTLLGGHVTLMMLLPVFLLTTLSRGLVSPNVTHAALENIPHMAGAGSALIGSMQMLTGALAGFIVGLMFDQFGPLGVMITMTGFAVPAVLAWIHVERTYR